ncbi:MAG: ABC transporter ATP-binding protein, partial [Paludibacteraceae bacterium]|nr:ABC transporter ATP-binding protein [Paludibacteraceae bacterium]
AHSLNKVIFLSTHDLEQALQVSDKIWLLDQQKGLTTGTTDELCRNNQIGAYFDREGLKFDPVKRLFVIR